jgi:hypothetical protein
MEGGGGVGPPPHRGWRRRRSALGAGGGGLAAKGSSRPREVNARSVRTQKPLVQKNHGWPSYA